MIKSSAEQEAIIHHVTNGLNIVTDAVAGAGKTTLILLLAKTFPNKKFIQITYNSQLKHEVRRKAQQYDLDNIEIHTYHSIIVNYYNKSAYTDIGIRQIVEGDFPPQNKLPPCDILVIDEAQDMTFLYYKMIRKFIKDLSGISQQLVLGDTFQGIYSFKGADVRFLSLADQLWHNPTKFIKMSMTTSYRITQPIAQFVNEILVGNDRIRAVKNGSPVQYIKHDIWDVHNVIVPEIQMLLSQGYRAEDIFILAGSVKSPRSPIKRLENALVLHGIKCYVPLSDEKKIDDNVITGKVIFTTFHQAKGRERKIVFVYGFDQSYYDYYARDEPRNSCPSTLYVAVTRALEKLYIIEDEKTEPLPFLKKPLTNCSFINYKRESYTQKKRISEAPERYINPTDLVKFLREDVLSQVTMQVETLYEEEREPIINIDIPNQVECLDGTWEEVSDINTLTIITMYEALLGKNPCTLEYLSKEYLDKVDHNFLTDAIKKVSKKCNDISDYLYLCNIYIAVRERLYFRLAQITDYNWLSLEEVTKCHSAMTLLGTNLTFEKELGAGKKKGFIYASPEYGNIKFKATVDAVDDSTVWMLKCVDDLITEHLLQMVVYSWIWKKCMLEELGPRQFKIMNIKNGQVLTLNDQSPLVENIINTLLQNVFDKGTARNDSEFLEWCCN